MADDAEAFRAALPDAAGAIVEGMEFGATELDCAPNLRIVQKFGADLRNIDLEACAARRASRSDPSGGGSTARSRSTSSP